MAGAPSNSQVDRAGNTLRDVTFDDVAGIDDARDLLDALDIVADHRQAHAYPLALATSKLAGLLECTLTGDPVVAQRLKRMPQIVRKLQRHRHMKLARMQDVAGCRAVMPDAQAVEVLRQAIVDTWDVRSAFDYRRDGKPETGYRGLHLVVLQPDGDRQRMVEVQLRTVAQQRWAITVERAALALRCPLKDGEGPAVAVEYFRLASEAIDLHENARPVAGSIAQRLDELKPALLARTGRCATSS